MAYDKNANYCTFSPDGLGKYSWKHYCYYHDRQTRNEVKFRKTRKQADISLREGMKRVLPKYLHFIAHIYYYTVRSLGWIPWVK